MSRTSVMYLAAKVLFAAPALSALLGLAACAPEPLDKSLPYKLPESFGAGAAGADPGLDRWWLRFGQTELTRLIAMAENGNLDIAAASARLAQADAQARISGTGLLPQIGLSGGGSASQSSGTSAPGATRPQTRGYSHDLGLNVSWILDIWGRLQAGQRAAEFAADATIYDREAVRLTVQASVALAYFQHAAANERLRLTAENARNAERILGVIRERLAAGTGNALDVAQQETLVATQRALIPPFRQAAQQSRATLALLAGRPPQGFTVRASGVSGIGLPRISPGLPARLLIRRPDIRAAEATLAALNANVEAARKALLPSIELTGRTGFQSAGLAMLLRPESVIYTLAAGVVQSIFDGGRLRAEIDVSAARRQEALELYRRAIVSALVDVDNAVTGIRENAAREAALTVAAAGARRAFMLSEERLRQGTIDLVTLLNTQQSLYQAQDSLIQTRLARLQAAVNLFQALGGDWIERPLPRPAPAPPVVPVFVPPQPATQ